MSAYNIQCAICSEFFKNGDDIYSTECGHVFHKRCLLKWLKRSKTCPQCRVKCSRRLCRRLFVNFVEQTSDDDEKQENHVYVSYDWSYLCPRTTNPFAFKKRGLKFGQDEEGNDIYAARVEYGGATIPGYYVPRKKAVIISEESETYEMVDKCEFLDISPGDADYKWVAASNGGIPENAYVAGRSIFGDLLYFARAKYDGKILYGKLQHRTAYMPYKGQEVSNENYEVLVKESREIFVTHFPAQ